MRSLVLLFAAALLAPPALADDPGIRRKVAAGFAETREAIVMAIENRGLVINYVSHIGDMLRRTGADLGERQALYDHAETLEFCSAGLSRRMMAADPHDIVLCPFALSIYTLPGEPGTWVAYRRPHGKSAPEVEALLADIAREAGD